MTIACLGWFQARSSREGLQAGHTATSRRVSTGQRRRVGKADFDREPMTSPRQGLARCGEALGGAALAGGPLLPPHGQASELQDSQLECGFVSSSLSHLAQSFRSRSLQDQ
jgi:hypothetical protein